ncbi:MAG TPA: hypothetical protein VK152_10825, partial [Paludibacter sp.]|nr:hypothetical protein [Paludibacter sp.]
EHAELPKQKGTQSNNHQGRQEKGNAYCNNPVYFYPDKKINYRVQQYGQDKSKHKWQDYALGYVQYGYESTNTYKKNGRLNVKG